MEGTIEKCHVISGVNPSQNCSEHLKKRKTAHFLRYGQPCGLSGTKIKGHYISIEQCSLQNSA